MLLCGLHLVGYCLYLHSWCLLIWLCKWYASLLESVLDLSGCYEEVSVHQGTNSLIIQFGCLLWSFRCFGVSKLFKRSFKNVPSCWLGHSKVFASSLIFIFILFCFLFKPNYALLHLHQHLFVPHVESSSGQLHNADLTFGINSGHLILLLCHGKTRYRLQLAMKPLVSELSNYWTPDNGDLSVSSVVIPESLMFNFAKGLEVKHTSIVFWLLDFKSIVLLYGGKITKIVLLSKYFWTWLYTSKRNRGEGALTVSMYLYLTWNKFYLLGDRSVKAWTDPTGEKIKYFVVYCDSSELNL